MTAKTLLLASAFVGLSLAQGVLHEEPALPGSWSRAAYPVAADQPVQFTVAVRERTTCLRGGVRAAPGSGGSSPVGIGRRGVTPYGEMTPCEMTSGAPVISGGSSGGTSAMGRTTVAPATSAVSPVRKRCWRG